jgi:hypothetical protein
MTMASQPTRRSTRTGNETELGDLRFDQWFGTPMFEPDRLERMEERATTGRWPARVVAAAWLKLDARASQLRVPATSPAAVRDRVGQTGEVTPAAAPRSRARTRVSRALDRWAEREVATQARLERLMLPRRWQT